MTERRVTSHTDLRILTSCNDELRLQQNVVMTTENKPSYGGNTGEQLKANSVTRQQIVAALLSARQTIP